MLGELDAGLSPISAETYEGLNRREIQAERARLREVLRGEVQRFCRTNFLDAKPRDLATLHPQLVEHPRGIRLPYSEFIERVGRPHPRVFPDVPLHATVSVSPWGLQTEFPEDHLSKDLVEAFNLASDCAYQIAERGSMSWSRAKSPAERNQLSQVFRKERFAARSCTILCFALVEAYINGVAWEFGQTADLSKLSERSRRVITESKGPVGTLDKLVKVPRIVADAHEAPLHDSREPLKTFKEVIKPFRDSIVHASPFSAAEAFGGYDKLEKLYELSTETVREAAESAIQIVAVVHRFVSGSAEAPAWLPFFRSGRLERRDGAPPYNKALNADVE